MKTKIPDEVQMKLDYARSIEDSICRLHSYEQVFDQTQIDFSAVHIPKNIQKRFKDWIESQIIIEKTNINTFK